MGSSTSSSKKEPEEQPAVQQQLQTEPELAPEAAAHLQQMPQMPLQLPQQAQQLPQAQMQQIPQLQQQIPLQQQEQMPLQQQQLVPSAERFQRSSLPRPVRQQRAAPRYPVDGLSGFGARQSFTDDDPVETLCAAEAQPEPDPTVAGEGPLRLATRVEYSALVRDQKQDVFGLVTVEASSTPPPVAGSSKSEERQAMDIVCVLDVSGSMGGSKIDSVKSAVRFIIGQADPRDRISIVSFESSANRALRLRKMDAEGKDAATTATLRLMSGGGTSIGAGLDCGLAVMEQRRQRHSVSAILLLTDGQDRSARALIPGLMERARQARCSVYAFGFGKDHDAALLSEISEVAQTPFTYVEDTDKIGEAFAGTVGGLASVVAQAVEITLAGQVRLKAVHTPFTVTRASDTTATVLIPDVFAGERRDILVELEVPATAQGQQVLLEASGRYVDLQRGCQVQLAPVAMEAMCTDEPQPEQEPDEEVSAQRDRVEVARALEEAARHSDQGQFEAAQQLLSSREDSMKRKKMTPGRQALNEELQDAKHRMKTKVQWEQGGRAEVLDATVMHRTQRATNTTLSSGSAVKKSSKAMYLQQAQASMIDSCKASSSRDR
mmetsp:Transcript_51150/g.111016  ORF Transcript_51150/g.111016 Transcript_51150/m.111016 type:complete len:606 (-) Transcript_51150:288-2105(-)